MSSRSDLSDQYKLPNTTFTEHGVIHTSIITDRSRDLRRYRRDEQWNQIKFIGEGTSGEVWLQQQADTGSLRAVKALRKRQLSRQGTDCIQELEALAKFAVQQEEVIVKFYGWYENESQIFLAMEYFALGDLADHIATADISEHDTKQISIDILEGLDIMHSKGFTHRDLKPRNIFVVQKTPRWWVKIGDFGITKRTGIDQTALRTETGTPYFSAPETEPDDYQATVSYTSAVDMWSFGCVIYNVLAKTPPFLSRKAKRKPLNVEPLNGRMSADGIAFLLALLDVDPITRITAPEARQSVWLKLENFQQPILTLPSRERVRPSLPPRVLRPDSLHMIPGAPRPSNIQVTESAVYSRNDILQLPVFSSPPAPHSARLSPTAPPMPFTPDQDVPVRPNSASGFLESGLSNAQPPNTLVKKKSSMLSVFKASPNRRLLSAAESDDVGELRSALNDGADINTKGITGFTALSKAVEKGHERVVRYLLEHGADIDLKCSLKGTALHSAADDGLASMIKVLLEYNPNLEAQGIEQKTPLQYAARKGDVESIDLLLDKGANINSKNGHQETALWLAVDWKRANAVRRLLDRGADVNIPNYEDRTPLHKAAYMGLKEVTRLLLQKNPYLYGEDENRLTPRECAAKRKNYEVAEMIAAAEADAFVSPSGISRGDIDPWHKKLVKEMGGR
ncbi:MAG: hypothetical protein LQ342_007420 [Letrouitia transgressa]|nr:MAG: hypothetical protein LQ342_007420 [Letrouitia transgressa]